MAAQQKQDEDKLGTSVTYNDPNGTKQPIKMGDVTFVPGESVDLAELVNEDRAKELAKKLANNPAFSVEGGPDHKKLAEGRKKHEEEVAKKQEEADQKTREAAERQQNYKAPEHQTLEHETRGSRAQAPAQRGRS
jgi:hypothetical protein